MVIQCMYNELSEMIKMLVRHGNSFALILDKPVLELLNVDPTRPVAVSTTDGKSLLVAPLSGAEARTAKRRRLRQRPRRRTEKQGSI
jgi:antitoxin MazE